jgi:hypothetical protein
MANFIRYALASVCFAASVGCLALWWRSFITDDCVIVPYSQNTRAIGIAINCGECSVGKVEGFFASLFPEFTYLTSPQNPWNVEQARLRGNTEGYFRVSANEVSFPLWYPALIFALAGVGVLRFRRQFSIRSALVAVTVVAALLGMVVAL